MPNLLSTIVLCLLVIFSTATHANNDQFTLGLEAFRAADYQKALLHFEQAQAGGLDSDNLRYNIAVTHFKLGHYDKATALFTPFTEQPDWRDTALYNLARIEEKRGNMVAAFESFQDLASNAKDERIRAMAMWSMNKSRLLEALYKPWDVNLELSYGHDDNVGSFNKELDLNASDAGDEFYELVAQGHYLIHGNRLEGYFVTGSVYQREYGDLSEYGSSSFSVGLLRNGFFKDWKSRLAIDFSSSELDGDYFESRSAIKLSLKQSIGRYTYRPFIRVTYHNAGSEFARVGGWQTEIEARAERQFDALSLGAAYRLELNERNNFRAEPFYISYSPVRHRLHVDSQYSFNTSWKLYALFEYTKSEYSGTNSVIVGSDFVEESRSNDSYRVALDVEYKFIDQCRTFIRYQYYDASDTFDNYEFDKEEVSLGLRGFF